MPVPSAAETFPPAPDSVSAARRFAVAALAMLATEQVQHDVRTVVSELATNAVLHARTAFTVTVTLDGDRLRVAVSDGSLTRPRLRRVADPDSSTGRGLAMVALLSTAWGVEANVVGKTTWCELDVITDERSAADEADASGDSNDAAALLARCDDLRASPPGTARARVAA